MDDEWISAFEAFSRLAKYQGSGAGRAICSRAADGVIVARAQVLVRGEDREEDCAVPAEFWWARGDKALDQNWHSGDFETWIDNTIHCRAYGITFRSADIEDMQPPRRGSLEVERAEAGNYAPASRCLDELAQTARSRQEAETQIIRLCRVGMIASRCDLFRWRVEDRFGKGSHEAERAAVPHWFWEHCIGGPDSVLDWRLGAFVGRGEIDGVACSATARGVQFDVSGIVALEALLRAQESEAASGASAPVGPARRWSHPEQPVGDLGATRGVSGSSSWSPWFMTTAFRPARAQRA